MADDTLTTNMDSNDRIGVSSICVRLDEPFDRIVANNPELKIEQKSTGEIVFMSPPGGESGRRNSKLSFQLEAWSVVRGGECFDSSTLFELPNGAKRSPDASWIASERWKQLTVDEREGYPPICPDFVIELRSKSDSLVELQEKMEEYIANGAMLGWLIDPYQPRVHVYKPTQTPIILQAPQSISDEVILPEF